MLDLRGADTALVGLAAVSGNGATLAVNGTGTHNIVQMNLSPGAVFEGAGNLSVQTLNWDRGATVRGGGTLAVTDELRLTTLFGAPVQRLEGRTVNVSGTVDHRSGAGLQIAGGGRLNANGGYLASNGAILSDDLSSFNLGAAGVFTLSGGGRFDISGPFNTAAGSRFNVAGGQLVFASGFSKATAETALAGRFDVAAGAALDFTRRSRGTIHLFSKYSGERI